METKFDSCQTIRINSPSLGDLVLQPKVQLKQREAEAKLVEDDRLVQLVGGKPDNEFRYEWTEGECDQKKVTQVQMESGARLGEADLSLLQRALSSDHEKFEQVDGDQSIDD